MADKPAEEATRSVVRSDRKTRTGVVVSDKMDKTVIVSVAQTVRHPLYSKIYKRNTKFAAHDETNDAKVGDKVVLSETRPLSKTKRWRVVEVLERAK